MLSDTEASCLAIALAVRLKKKQQKQRRWMKEWLKKWNEYTHENFLKDLTLSEPSDFQHFL
jgi:histone deacetylase complex regulatory component SIN3